MKYAFIERNRHHWPISVKALSTLKQSTTSLGPGWSMSLRSRLATWNSARNFQANARERAQRTAFLRAIERLSVLAVTRETARSFGLLATMMKAAGRSPRPRYSDLWIAAQAHEHHLPLLTSNPDDFRALDVIEIIEAPKTAH